MEIIRSSTGIVLSQHNYTLQLLEETGYLGSKPTKIPMDPKTQLKASNGQPLSDPSQYRRLIGKLLYLTISRPDITYAVHCLSQYVSHPCISHLQAAHYLLRYLKSSLGQGLFFAASSSVHLRAFFDADWASSMIPADLPSAFVYSWVIH